MYSTADVHRTREWEALKSVMLTWAIVSLLFCSVIVVGHEQQVETVLLSKWAPTSILSEAAEFLSEVDPDLYWRFVDNVLAQQGVLAVPSNGMYILFDKLLMTSSAWTGVCMTELFLNDLSVHLMGLVIGNVL